MLEVWRKADHDFHLAESIPVLAWSGELGPKLAEGERQAPEGFYEVTADALNPASKYHRSFDLGFPNAFDRSHGRTGSHLMIHGGDESVGCYAIGDEAIERVYDLVESATARGGSVAVHCFPFRLTAPNLMVRSDSEWIEFWQYDLAPAYLWFETTRRIPVVDERYRLV